MTDVSLGDGATIRGTVDPSISGDPLPQSQAFGVPEVAEDTSATGLAGTAIATWMKWRSAWVQGTVYKLWDVVRDGEWTMVCVTESPSGTTERPGVVPQGEQYRLIPDAMGSDSVTAKQLTFGQRYQFPRSGYISGVWVDTVIGNQYTVWAINNPLEPNAVGKQLLSFTATASGWNNYPVASNQIVTEQSVLDIYVTATEPDPTPVEVEVNYDYRTPNNAGIPASGECQQSNGDVSTLRFDFIDDDGTDREALLLSLEPGDVVSTTSGDWSVQAVLDKGTYAAVAVAPAMQQGSQGVRVFALQTTDATPITFGHDVDHWVGSPVQGIFSQDGGAQVFSDDAYGVDITVQDAYVPTQFEVLARSST